MSQAQDDQWREQAWSHGAKALEVEHQHHREQRLRQENTRLTQLEAELTLELTKNEEVWP